MYLSVDLSVSEKFIVAFHKLSASFFVQGALWKGDNQQALNNFENVRERPLRRVPVLLQGVDTDLT